ncbi:hypothetical protein HC928_04510 [bacterium]|nr:hypothetical protein [bacterium]
MKTLEVNFFSDWTNKGILWEQKAIAVDTETTALEPDEGKIRLIQVYLPSIHQVAVIDFFSLTPECYDWVNELLLVTNNPKVIKYFQNALFDLKWIRAKFGVTSRNIRDTMILSQVEKAGLINGYLYPISQRKPVSDSPNSLKYLCQQFKLNHDKSEQSSDWGYPNLSQEQILYAARDVVSTYQIGEQLWRKLSFDQKTVIEAENSCIPAFSELIDSGMPCRYEILEKVYQEYLESSKKEKTRLEYLMDYDPVYHEKVVARERLLREEKAKGIKSRKKPFKDKPFNASSTKQIMIYLKSKGYDERELQKLNKETGEWSDSSSKDILFTLLANHPDHYELKEISYYRGVSRAASTLKTYLDAYDHRRKYIKTSYRVLAPQGMGRSASGDKRAKYPSSQVVSKYLLSHQAFSLPPIRSIVTARKGYSLYEFDLEASHTQFASVLSNDPSLKKSREEGIKIHYFTLSSMLKMEGKNYSPEDCILLHEGKLDRGNHSGYKALYKLAKNVIYSFINYSGGKKLSETFAKEEMIVSVEDCKRYLEACARQYWKLRQFQDEVYEAALENAIDIYAPTGELLGRFARSYPLDDSVLYHRGFCKRDEYGNPMRQRGEYQYSWKISDIVSGQWLRPEATVIKSALGKITEFKEENDYDFRLVNFSHDSFMIEVLDEHAEFVCPVCYDELNQSMRRYIPFYDPKDQWQQCRKSQSWEK